ncbi:MAG: MotA/TolQ/ExbB proton channel family protein [Planctomycetes bacterium]|nr:MotA/TolQ/ExbB proton channel family protein [Planctomycetota bacterium]
MSASEIYNFVGNLTYGFLAVAALWGAYCTAMIWSRINQKRFRTEDQQDEFLNEVDQSLSAGRFDEAHAACDGDVRAVCQLAALAIHNRRIGYDKVRQLVLDRFQRDVMADLEQRVVWVNTVIKSAPMLGLFGTVLGMMGAFGKLAAAENVKADQLASDISLALITTACGLAIAIPGIVAVTLINSRIRRLEDLVAVGLTRFFETFRAAIGNRSGK